MLIKKGDRGSSVRQIQQALHSIGYDIVIDGIYGLKTAGVVANFQATYNLIPNGQVDDITFNTMKKVLTGEIKRAIVPLRLSVAEEFSGIPLSYLLIGVVILGVLIFIKKSGY